jgi:hypothetical protein
MTTTNVYLKNKVEERVAQSAVMEGMTDTAARESRDLTEQERKTYEGIAARLVFLDDEIKRITEAEQGAAKFAQVYGQHRQALATQDRLDAQRRAAGAAQVPVESRAITWGTAFTRSEQFKHYDGHGSSAAFTIEGDWLGGQSWTIEERAEVVDPEPATPPSFEQQWDLHFPPGTNVMASAWGDNAPRQTWAGPRQPDERYPLMDVIGRVPTNQGSIEYMYWWLDPEAMAEEVPEGELKPEAELSGELKAMPVATYAWWKGVTRQALEDIPQIRAVIDGFLRKGVLRRINRAALDALHGDPNIPEIGAATDPLLSLIRVAVAFVDDAGFTPNAVIMNPFDWAAFDIALMEGQGATDMQRLFWNLRPVTLPSVPSGTAYVGDFREAITFFDRRQTQVFMTDSHGDYFIRNKLAILAEARGRIAVTNAAAMVKCEGVVPDAIVPATISLHSSAAARRERDRNRTASRAAARPAEPRRPAAPPSA